jgi:hypothetical protein
VGNPAKCSDAVGGAQEGPRLAQSKCIDCPLRRNSEGVIPRSLPIGCDRISCHHEKLYAPRDFQTDDAFLTARSAARPLLAELDKKIEEKVTSVLTAQDLIRSIEKGGHTREALKAAADRITNEIRSSSFVTIDARDFMEDREAVLEYPVSAFASVNELLNQVYNNAVCERVGPYEYGESWVLRNETSGTVFRTLRMIKDLPARRIFTDRRTLAEAGIVAGTRWVVERPEKNVAPASSV